MPAAAISPIDWVIWPEPPKVQADPALYDALYHSAAVTGLNTSAMIEAGIPGKPQCVYGVCSAN